MDCGLLILRCRLADCTCGFDNWRYRHLHANVCSPRRITELHHDHSVVYVPNEAWVGSDAFTYATIIGVDESSRVQAVVHVRKCRIDCSNDIVNDVAFPTIT